MTDLSLLGAYTKTKIDRNPRREHFKMPDLAANVIESVGGIPIKNMMMCYNLFVPRLDNKRKSLGFEVSKTVPPRAF